MHQLPSVKTNRNTKTNRNRTHTPPWFISEVCLGLITQPTFLPTYTYTNHTFYKNVGGPG